MSNLTHLQKLEAESIHILREVVATCEKPVMLYSIGKDSTVLLHLAMKAFYPAKPPFPLLHVDTTWKFREMIAFRDEAARRLGIDLIVHINEEGVKAGVRPFASGSRVHTDVMKTEGLKQALDKYGFDAAFGGARRDEEKSRAKERVFSLRSAQHRWDPKGQRPEPWRLYNTRKKSGESFRVFPLSNWTEADVWDYVALENIPVVPLYFAAPRPVVERDGALIMVDDGACNCATARACKRAWCGFARLAAIRSPARWRARRRTLRRSSQRCVSLASPSVRAASSTMTDRPRWSLKSRKVISDERSCFRSRGSK